MCKFWLRDFSFPDNTGYCSLKQGVTAASFSCELFRRKVDDAVAVKVISY